MLRRARSFLELENAELALKVYYKHECRQKNGLQLGAAWCWFNRPYLIPSLQVPTPDVGVSIMRVQCPLQLTPRHD